MIIPSFLQPGAKVSLVATSGAVKELAALEKGVEIWRSRGYQVEFSEYLSNILVYHSGRYG